MKHKASTLSLLFLFTLFLLHGFLPAEKVKAYDMKAKAVILLDQAPEDLAGQDSDEKKTFISLSTLALLLLIQHFLITHNPSNNFKAIRAFLLAVFYQSNYVIRPLRF
jgi:hypothetical protein